MVVKTYRKTALVTAEQFLPEISQIPDGVYSTALGDPAKRPDAAWVLDTNEGRHAVRGGDYICTGPKGEKWNVARDIFENTYEEIAPPNSKYLNLIDGKIYEIASLDGYGVNFKREGRETTYYLCLTEFERRFSPVSATGAIVPQVAAEVIGAYMDSTTAKSNDEPCPACANEERGQGGYLSCECPAIAASGDQS